MSRQLGVQDEIFIRHQTAQISILMSEDFLGRLTTDELRLFFVCRPIKNRFS